MSVRIGGQILSRRETRYVTVVSYSYVSDSCVHYSCAYNCSDYSEAKAMYAALRPNTPGQLKVQWSSIAMSARNYISSKFKGHVNPNLHGALLVTPKVIE